MMVKEMPAGEHKPSAQECGGLVCPACDGREFDVLDTRRPKYGRYIRRRRECRNCGCKVTTSERIVG